MGRFGRFRAQGFGLLLNEAVERAPVDELIQIMDVGFTCAYLTDAMRFTGSTV